MEDKNGNWILPDGQILTREDYVMLSSSFDEYFGEQIAYPQDED